MSHTPEHTEQLWMDNENSQEKDGQSLAPVVVNRDEDDSGSDVSESSSRVENSSMHLQQSQAETDGISVLTTDGKLLFPHESINTIKQRLAELEAVEDALQTRKSKLIAKRKRKDERTKTRIFEEEERVRKQREEEEERARKQREEEEERIRKQREEEDERIRKQREEEEERIRKQREEEVERIRKQEEENAHRIRNRIAKGDRTLKRREREDEEYRKMEKEHDDEENELRRRLKTLKRGLPVSEEIIDSTRASTISESMSPPSKKHQPNPPAIHTTHLPSLYNTLQLVQSHPPEPPPSAQHPFHYGWNGPPAIETYDYTTKDAYQDQHLLSSAPVLNGSRLPSYTASSAPPPPPTPAGPPSDATLLSHYALSTHQAQPPPPRPPAGLPSYDIHPPLPTSNFTSVNAPSSGFPSINQPQSHPLKTPLRTVSKKKRAKQAAAKVQGLDAEAAVLASPTHLPGGPTTPTSVPGGKRKASTTHPYSQSEAFANRHQHCERTDELDRGIWTYFGPGGSKEAPTVAGKKEMYLRCSHDGCMRIDWKTIHGLQCHIVKNHGVLKGTIGSLELALEKYGIEVLEIEEHEKKHGLGSGGTMAEKTPRIKSRTRTSNGTDMSESSTPIPGTIAGPAVGSSVKSAPASRVKSSAPIILFPNLQARSPSGGYVQDDIVYSEDESDGDHPAGEIKQSAHKNKPHRHQWKASDSELSIPSTFTVDRDDKLHESNSHSASSRRWSSHLGDGLNSLPPRPTSSTETLSVPDTAPKPTENHTAPSLKHSLQPPTQLQSIGNETQKILSAAEKVNARLDAEDSDFIATPLESDIASQTQSQTQHQTLPQTPNTDSYEPIPSTKPTTANTTSTSTSTATPSSRPRGGAERRVPASERWDWAPVEDDDDNDRGTNNTNTNTNTNGTSRSSTLTKAQLELQSLDDSITESETGAAVAEDGGVGGSATVMATGKSPTTTARYSARKKIQTRRGRVAYN